MKSNYNLNNFVVEENQYESLGIESTINDYANNPD